MLEPLLSQQRKGIFQCCFPPPVLAEVVAEEVCHFCILLGPGERETLWIQSKVFSNLTELTVCACMWICILYAKLGQFFLPVQSPDHRLLFQCKVK